MRNPPSHNPALFRLDSDPGFAPRAASVGAAQRAGLGRGLAFVLVLAASSLASVYLPMTCQGPHWVEGRASPPPAGDVLEGATAPRHRRG